MRGIILSLLMILVCSSSDARPFSVDDLISLHSYGQVITSGRRRTIMFERRRSYSEAPDFGYGGYFNDRALGQILVVSATKPERRAMPLFPQQTDAGYWLGSLSPDENRVTVFRLRRRSLTLGVVDISSHQVKWLAIHPDGDTVRSEQDGRIPLTDYGIGQGGIGVGVYVEHDQIGPGDCREDVVVERYHDVWTAPRERRRRFDQT